MVFALYSTTTFSIGPIQALKSPLLFLPEYTLINPTNIMNKAAIFRMKAI